MRSGIPSKGVNHAYAASRKLAGMSMLMAFSEAVQTDLALLGIFAVVFPAIVTGCIIFAAAQAASERQQNAERKHGRSR